MSNIFKVFRLDMLIIKQYIKTILYFLLIPVLFVMSTKSIVSGIITTMTLIPMRAISVVFLSEEKNNINKFYGFIPVKKTDLVFGRYFSIIVIGIISLLISIVLQSFILIPNNVHIEVNDLFISLFLGITVYFISISLQIPGFYKLGGINGAIFSYVPLIVFFIFNYLIGSLDIFGIKTLEIISKNLALISIIVLFISIIVLLLSIKISIKILKIKE